MPYILPVNNYENGQFNAKLLVKIMCKLTGDPRRGEMKDIINLKVKQRESFRPFAPSVLEEKSYRYFGNPVQSPFMLFAFKVNPERQKEIPAVTHVDGTARPQTVSREVNPFLQVLSNASVNRDILSCRTIHPVIPNLFRDLQIPSSFDILKQVQDDIIPPFTEGIRKREELTSNNIFLTIK